MKPEIPPTIVEPCPLSWEGMQGGDKRRFCEHCQLHVHNLSKMTKSERTKLLASDGHLCVTYAVDERGSLLEQARRHWLLDFFSRARTALIALTAAVLPLGTSCASRQVMGTPVPPQPSPSPTPPPNIVVPGGIAPPPPNPSPAPEH